MLLYDYPEYYEVAFSFRNLVKEADFINACVQRYSHIPVERLFEVACGPAPHAKELVRRGYRYSGLDINRTMIDHARYKWKHLGDSVDLVEGCMLDFSYARRVDFAYVMLGSLYLNGMDELNSHFDAIANILRPGGLYFLDWCVQFSDPLKFADSNSYSIERDGILVESEFAIRLVDIAHQMYEEVWSVNVNDRGRRRKFVMTERNRAIFPDEFRCVLDSRNDFEFVGWWRDWDFEKPVNGRADTERPIILIRRTG